MKELDNKLKLLSFNKKLLQYNYLTEKLSKNGLWVNYGNDNKLPIYLAELSKESPTHSGILKTKKRYGLGKGFENNIITNEITNESLNSIYSKLLTDYLIYGGFAIRIVWVKGVPQLFHIDFSKIRSGRQNEYGIVEKYYMSSDWSQPKGEKIEIPRYDGKATSDKLGKLAVFFEYDSGVEYYPLPDYFGALKAITNEIESQIYLSSVMTNSYLPRNVFSFAQEFTPEEERMLINKLDSNYKGVENAGQPIILTNMQSESSVKIENLDYTLVDPNFSIIDDNITQKIISSHRIPRILATLNDPNGFSNKGEEMLVASELFQTTVIGEIQSYITSAISSILNVTIDLPVPLEIIKAQLSEATLKEILSTDELRTLYGYNKIDSNGN